MTSLPVRFLRLSLARRELLAGVAFVSPWVIGFLAFTLFPMLAALYYSFTDYNLLSAPRWVGLENYTTAFAGDPLFWRSLSNTAVYGLMTVLPGTVFAILLALLLNSRVRGLAVFRSLYFLPIALPLVAVSVVWKTVLDPQYGYLNALLHTIGVPHPPGWLADPTWSKPAFAILGMWSVSASVVIHLAALQGVPEQLYEAARIDGAGTLRRLWHVTLPMISPAILFNMVLTLIANLQFFTIPVVMIGTTGGPLQSGLFYSPYLWQNGFNFFKMGYASALAWILFVIIMAATALLLRASRDRVYYEVGP